MLPHSLFRALASLLALSVFITGSVHAAVYDYAMGDAGNRTVRLNVPEGLSVVRGILIWGNGGNSDLRGMATDPEVVALAESMGFAVLATSMWTNFLPGYTPSEISGFEFALERLAALSNRPELVRAPWLPVGHSNGGNISFGLNTLRPDKVIAVAVNKSEKVNDLRPATTALRTPTLMVAGDADTEARRVGIRDLFFGNRPRGLLGAWVEEEGSNHTYGDAFELILPFAEEIYRLRYPSEVSPAVAPVTLLGVNETTGWLIDPESHLRGLAEIAVYADYSKDRAAAGWLPSRRMAYIYRAFASYDLSKFEAEIFPRERVINSGEAIRYTIGEPTAAWTSIEFYDGDVLLKRIQPGDGAMLEVDDRPSRLGYAVYHALVTLADGTRRTTMARRMFVRAATGGTGAISGAPIVLSVGQRAPEHAVAAGTPVTLSVVARERPAEFRWYRDGVAMREFTGPSVEFLAGSARAGNWKVAAMGSGGSRSEADLGVLRIVSNAWLVNLSARGWVDTGDNVLIGGFVAQSDVSGTAKTVLMRGIGPELSRFVGGGAALDGVKLTWLNRTGTPIQSATNWDASLAVLFNELGASALTPGGGDAALVRSFTVPGVFTAHVAASQGPAGIGMVEVYDADAAAPGSRLVNLSVRAQVGTGDRVLIGGFVVGGSTSTTLMVRAIGPGNRKVLRTALPQTTLTLFDVKGREIARNRGYGNPSSTGDSAIVADVAATTAKLAATVGAPLLLPSRMTGYDASWDSAVVVTLPPGVYTAHVNGVEGATGIGMIEIYEVK